MFKIRLRPEVHKIAKEIDKVIWDLPGVPDDKFPEAIKQKRAERHRILNDVAAQKEKQLRGEINRQ